MLGRIWVTPEGLNVRFSIWNSPRSILTGGGMQVIAAGARNSDRWQSCVNQHQMCCNYHRGRGSTSSKRHFDGGLSI
jgi:hypothetical protein